MTSASRYGDGGQLDAEAEVGADEIVVRCAAANMGMDVVYLLHLDFGRSTPVEVTVPWLLWLELDRPMRIRRAARRNAGGNRP